MKKALLTTVLATVLPLMFGAVLHAQKTAAPYNTSFGLFLDLGNGGTFVGPHVKHFFTEQDAGQAMIMFGNDLTVLGVEYSYNKPVPNASGLSWNAGIGPQVYFGDDLTGFLIRPQVGMEFKVPKAPIAVGFDWRPMWELTHETDFEAGRFGLSFKYAL